MALLHILISLGTCILLRGPALLSDSYPCDLFWCSKLNSPQATVLRPRAFQATYQFSQFITKCYTWPLYNVKYRAISSLWYAVMKHTIQYNSRSHVCILFSIKVWQMFILHNIKLWLMFYTFYIPQAPSFLLHVYSSLCTGSSFDIT